MSYLLMLLSKINSTPSLRHVVDVIGLAAKTEMGRVYTRWGIAFMAHNHVIRNRAVGKLVSEAVCSDRRLSGDRPEIPIPFITIARPKPTTAAFINVLPKPFSSRKLFTAASALHRAIQPRVMSGGGELLITDYAVVRSVTTAGGGVGMFGLLVALYRAVAICLARARAELSAALLTRVGYNHSVNSPDTRTGRAPAVSAARGLSVPIIAREGGF